MADDPRAPARSIIRRHFLRMVLLIVAIAAAALTLRELTGIARRPVRTQLVFTGAWMIANIIVVTSGLTRIRAARVAARRGRRR